MARNQGKSFFEAHWDWLVAAGGVALVAVSYVFNFILADDVKPRVTGGGQASEEIAAVDLSATEGALKGFRAPEALAALNVKGSFLASHARTFCTPADGEAGCGAVLLPELETCSACGKSQKEASEKMVLDRDEDGMTDEYETAHGLNPDVDDRDEDLDGDGFTNWEEFEAKTKPNDPLDHPDYFEAKRAIVKVLGVADPVKSTLQFIGRGPYPIGDKGYRFSFYDPAIRKAHKNLGNYDMTAFVGEEIKLERTSATGKKLKPISTGFTLIKYNEKIERVQARGVAGKKEVDRSSVTLKRNADGVEFEFALGRKDKPRATVLDMKAKVAFDGVRDTDVFEVGKGDKIDLVKYGASFTVEKIGKADDNPDHVTVTLKNDVTGKRAVFISE